VQAQPDGCAIIWFRRNSIKMRARMAHPIDIRMITVFTNELNIETPPIKVIITFFLT